MTVKWHIGAAGCAIIALLCVLAFRVWTASAEHMTSRWEDMPGKKFDANKFDKIKAYSSSLSTEQLAVKCREECNKHKLCWGFTVANPKRGNGMCWTFPRFATREKPSSPPDGGRWFSSRNLQ